jgi:hypothetical protein
MDSRVGTVLEKAAISRMRERHAVVSSPLGNLANVVAGGQVRTLVLCRGAGMGRPGLGRSVSTTSRLAEPQAIPIP